MHGVGRAYAAVSIVNALSTGVGCALGIDLAVTAEATILPGFASDPSTPGMGGEDRSPLIDAAVAEAMTAFVHDPGASATVVVWSDVPVAKGLKSSSAVASAVVAAVAHAANTSPSRIEVARASALAGRRAGVSATGAFDDALAGLSSGFVVTDNHRQTLLRSRAADPHWEVGVLLPQGTHPPSPVRASAFAARNAEGRRAVDAALAGRFWDAMDRNSRLVEETMGYDRARLRARLRAAGALGSGVSGLGPAFAAVAPSDRMSEVLEVLRQEEGEVRRARLLRAVGEGSA